MSKRLLVAIFTAVAASGWLTMAATSQQGGQRRVVTIPDTVRPPRRPAPVSDSARAHVLKPLALKKWPDPKTRFSLSPNHPYMANRGRLNFREPKLVLTGQDQVALLGRGYVQLMINAGAKGQRFLAECAVSCNEYADKKCSGTLEESGSILSGLTLFAAGYTIEDSKPGTQKREFSAEPGGQHLLTVLEAFRSGENIYRISAGGPWWFYACEVTPL